MENKNLTENEQISSFSEEDIMRILLNLQKQIETLSAEKQELESMVTVIEEALRRPINFGGLNKVLYTAPEYLAMGAMRVRDNVYQALEAFEAYKKSKQEKRK